MLQGHPECDWALQTSETMHWECIALSTVQSSFDEPLKMKPPCVRDDVYEEAAA